MERALAGLSVAVSKLLFSLGLYLLGAIIRYGWFLVLKFKFPLVLQQFFSTCLNKLTLISQLLCKFRLILLTQSSLPEVTSISCFDSRRGVLRIREATADIATALVD